MSHAASACTHLRSAGHVSQPLISAGLMMLMDGLRGIRGRAEPLLHACISPVQNMSHSVQRADHFRADDDGLSQTFNMTHSTCSSASTHNPNKQCEVILLEVCWTPQILHGPAKSWVISQYAWNTCVSGQQLGGRQAISLCLCVSQAPYFR